MGINSPLTKFDFVDITRPNYSHLGKIYIDRTGGVFIIPLDKKLYKYNALNATFEPIDGVSDASTIFQDKSGTYWVGTYSRGLLYFDSNFESAETIIGNDLLSSAVYDIALLDQETLLITADKKIVEVNFQSKQFEIIVPESLLGGKINQNFSVSIKENV